jgi:hypothetical protein
MLRNVTNERKRMRGKEQAERRGQERIGEGKRGQERTGEAESDGGEERGSHQDHNGISSSS